MSRKVGWFLGVDLGISGAPHSMAKPVDPLQKCLNAVRGNKVLEACLEGAPTEQEWQDFVQDLRCNDRLRDLRVNVDLMDNDRLQSLLTSLKETWVNYFALCLNHNAPKLTTTLANALPDLRSIESLNLRWCGNNDGLLELGKVLGASRLHILELHSAEQGHAQISPVELTALMNGLKTSRISMLSLDGCVLGDEGAKALAVGLPHTRLRYVDVARTAISDEGIKAIAAALKDSNVDTMVLCENTFGKSGLEALAAGVRDTAVTHLTYCLNNRCLLLADHVTHDHKHRKWLLRIAEALKENWDRSFLLQMEAEELERDPVEWKLTFRTLGGTVAAVLEWSSECPEDCLPSEVFHAMRIGKFPLPSRHLRETNLRLILPNGRPFDLGKDMIDQLGGPKRRRLSYA
jgi:hypothetical protein